MFAPALTASEATFDFLVSILIGTSDIFLNFSIRNATLLISWSSEISTTFSYKDLGLVDSAPISIISTPLSVNDLIILSALLISVPMPSPEKESSVKLTIPTTAVLFSRSNSKFPIFIHLFISFLL